MSGLPRGRIKAAPEDFVVEELPAYAPSGRGTHLFVRFTKRNMTTPAAVRAIADAAGVATRDVGVAGLKDKVGVTTQWISLPAPPNDAAFDDRVRALSLDGITIHEAARHENKLKTGHLAGNRFAIVVRGLDEAGAAEAKRRLDEIGRVGIPNAFGVQRFGREGDNAERALGWLTGRDRPPRDKRLMRLHWSALQSKVFNAVLEARVADGTWTTPLEGDLVKRHDTGGLFLCTDVQTDRERALRGEVSPTGPIPGAKMRRAEGKPGALEDSVSMNILGKEFDFARVRALGEGTRRSLRLWVEGMKVEAKSTEQGAGLGVYFVLPKGSYATTVLAGALVLESEHTNEVQRADESVLEDLEP
jgi:tRNA pseudouridine13 synthase